MTIRFRDYLNERLKDDDFRADYEAVEREERHSLMMSLRKTRKANRINAVRLSVRVVARKKRRILRARERSNLTAMDTDNLKSCVSHDYGKVCYMSKREYKP